MQEVAEIAQWEDEQIEYIKEKVTEEGKEADLKKGKAPAQVLILAVHLRTLLGTIDNSKCLIHPRRIILVVYAIFIRSASSNQMCRLHWTKLPSCWIYPPLKGIGMTPWKELLNVIKRQDSLMLRNLYYTEIEEGVIRFFL